MEKSTLVHYLPIFIMFLIAVAFVVVTMIASHLLGPKKYSKVKYNVFECGIHSEGNARNPFAVKYFLTALLFVLFDVEVIFMYPWATNFKELGMFGVIEVLVFTALLLVGLYYLLKKDVLNINE
ncbi:MAG: NADH-quinone oxidoreductase subunit A [Bacteroidia bacterium]|nr:MAG: NADH-quinone oxidoreductase subunit A [Bacteroidia bacterium]